jgi:N utilization substance protein A
VQSAFPADDASSQSRLPTPREYSAGPRPYGARSEESVIVGDLLKAHVPPIARGDIEILAIARRPMVLTKVAVRRRAGAQIQGRPVALVVGLGADLIRRVSRELGGERVQVVQWHRDPAQYIAEALGLGYVPSTLLIPPARWARVFLGEIDFPGVRGWRATNVLLASALTSWRIRLQQIARSPAWTMLERARLEQRPVTAWVVGRSSKGLRVQVYGLNGLLPIGQIAGVRRSTPPHVIEARLRERMAQELQVQVLRLDPDAGGIFVSERGPAGRQLRLPL